MKNTFLKLLSQYYFTLINLVLITLFIGAGTGSGYKILTGIMDTRTIAPVKDTKSGRESRRKTRRKKISYYDVIAGRNLFKVATLKDLKKKDEVQKVDELDLTDLKLKLWGTIVAGDEYSRAIIEETKTRTQKLYRKGDIVQTATLKRILRNKVVLNVSGKDEVLEVEQKTSKSRVRRPGSSRTNVMSSTAVKDISVKRSLIDESMKNLNQLMKDVRIRPHFKNGQSDGLIVSGIKSGSVFRKLGLRNGDIIMGVDGKQIESVDDAMKLYSGLKDMEDMKVDIKRRGRMQTLNFNIE